jgi:hypothetical protein
MYEWVKTKRGWRIFWGVDPCANQPEERQPETVQEDESQQAQGPILLPFRPSDLEGDDRPAA